VLSLECRKKRLLAAPVLQVFPRIEEPDASQLNLRLALIDTTMKDYAPCLMLAADDPELISLSTSISA